MTRPRVAGDRVAEILETTLGLLAEVGYDRLHLDLVADRARVSKATIYRHWHGKSRLVVHALDRALAGRAAPPDTGTLRDDLVATLGDRHGLGDPTLRAALSGAFTASTFESGLGKGVRRDILAGPLCGVREIFTRARARGEIQPDADVELLTSVVVGFVVYGHLLADDAASASESLTGLVDRVVVPAALKDPGRPRS